MPKPRATSSTTSSGSTITYVCTLHWVICRPMYTNANRQPNHLSTCPKTLDHYTMLVFLRGPFVSFAGAAPALEHFARWIELHHDGRRFAADFLLRHHGRAMDDPHFVLRIGRDPGTHAENPGLGKLR